MKRFKNILIPVNLTKMDTPVIHFASIISKIAALDKLYFLHINRSLHIPDEIRAKYPLLQPLKEYSEGLIKESVESVFGTSAKINADYSAVEGVPIKELLSHIMSKNIDLVIIGRKTNVKETRLLPVKIARKAPCSVLVVPEGVKPSIKNILVPIDFSENSYRAIDVAIAIASSVPNGTIKFVNVYELPIGYSKTGKSAEEFGAIMKSNAIKSYEKLIKKIDFKKVPLSAEFLQHKKPAVAIRELIEKEQFDMVILGARGISESAGLLLGSVTENLLLSTQIPLIVVKRKGEGLNLLEAIFKYV